MGWIARIVIAVVAAVVAYLVCELLGAVLAMLGVPIAAEIGHFISRWAGVISVLVFLYYLVVGYATVPTAWYRPARTNHP